jgi:hypothetical protein
MVVIFILWISPQILIILHVKPHGKEGEDARTHKGEHGCQGVNGWQLAIYAQIDEGSKGKNTCKKEKQQAQEIEKNQRMEIADNIFF